MIPGDILNELVVLGKDILSNWKSGLFMDNDHFNKAKSTLRKKIESVSTTAQEYKNRYTHVLELITRKVRAQTLLVAACEAYIDLNMKTYKLSYLQDLDECLKTKINCSAQQTNMAHA